MIIGENSQGVQNGRRRNLGSATSLDVIGGAGGAAAGGPSTPGGRNLGQAQFHNPLPSPHGAAGQRPEFNGRTEYGNAYFREGVSSPKDHVLTKNAADRIRRTSESANSPTGHPQKSPSSPLPMFGGVVHHGHGHGHQHPHHGKAGAPPSHAAGAGSHGKPLPGRILVDRHSDSPRSPAAAAAPASPMFGIPPARAPSSGSGPFALGGSSSDVAAALRAVGARVASTYDSRGVAAVLSGSLPPAGAHGSGRGRTPNAALPEQEANLTEVIAGYGSCSLQGLRDYQEDALGFLQSGDSLAGGVFDGHGGDQVSRELERCLLQNMMRAISELAARDQGCMGPSPANVQAAIAKAYTQTNQDISMRVPHATEAGSCAVTFVITRAAGVLHLFCANAGDCRAVLCTGPAGSRKPVRLSEDHKPVPTVCPSEIARVTAAGGCVLWGRVQGCLAVSRAFGDKALQPYVIADPYVSVRPLNVDQDTFLYLASDGVTDMVDDAFGCQVVGEALAKGQSAGQAAQALVNAAYQKGSSDNISAIVVRLRKR